MADHIAAVRSRITDWQARIRMMENGITSVLHNGRDATNDFIAELRSWIAEDEKMIAHIESMSGKG